MSQADTALSILNASIALVKLFQGFKRPQAFPDGSVITPEQVQASADALHTDAQAGIAEREAAIRSNQGDGADDDDAA